MDVLLSRVTQHAMNYAIRSGVSIATGYTIKQCGRLLQQTPKSQEREEIAYLQTRLESKIRIISPAIDMIELISARGHTSLECAITLTKDIRLSIQNLGAQLRAAAEEQDLIHRKSKRAKRREETEYALQSIIKEMKMLITKINDAVPLVNLAITTSGVNLSTKLSTTVSPSRLLQASTFLTAADTSYAMDLGDPAQVGPTFVVSLYMLFAGHASRAIDEAGVRDTTWKEVMHKAHVKLVRLPLDSQMSQNEQDASTFRESARAAEFTYQLVITEDLDDDRVHSEDEPTPFEGVQAAGMRHVVPIHEISKLFYADTGKILNIRGDDEDNTPILLLKRDVNAAPPRRMVSCSPGVDHNRESNDRLGNSPSIGRKKSPKPDDAKESKDSKWRLPADLDLEWMALEVFHTSVDSDDGSCDDDDATAESKKRASGSSLDGLFSALSFRQTSSSPAQPSLAHTQHVIAELQATCSREAVIKTSLSLLEMLIKLTALQQFRQESHLAIEDELLNFFLEESATAGASGDKHRRQHLRQQAIKTVGFDPYDESPIKRRGEAYIQAANTEGFQPSTALLIHPGEHRRDDSRSGSEATPLKHYAGIRSLHSPQLLLKHQTPILMPAGTDLIDSSPSPLLLNGQATNRRGRVELPASRD